MELDKHVELGVDSRSPSVVSKFMQRGICKRLSVDPAFSSVVRDLVRRPGFTEKYVFDEGFCSDVNRVLLSRVPRTVSELVTQECVLCDIAAQEGVL